jgi:hypothetical protein
VSVIANVVRLTQSPTLNIKYNHSPPGQLIFPLDYFPFEQPDAQAVLEGFVSKLEGFLQMKRTVMNMDALWRSDDPSGTGLGLAEYLDTVRVLVRNLCGS